MARRGSQRGRFRPSDPMEARTEARRCAGQLRLGLQRRTWEGRIGSMAGAGTGSSIDFQDHRPYFPGDDPRHIDWAAYARSGQTIMKLYREEVSPRLDLVLDVSRSMVFASEKRDQVLRLFYFCLESALGAGAALRVWTVSGAGAAVVPPETWSGGGWDPSETPGAAGPPALDRVPFRSGSLRVLLTDVLYDAPPFDTVTRLTERNGRGVVLAPWMREEERPDWEGNLELVDCERHTVRRQRVDRRVLDRYRRAYARHLDAWRESCRRYGVAFARVPCGVSLARGLEAEALPTGVVETWG